MEPRHLGVIDLFVMARAGGQQCLARFMCLCPAINKDSLRTSNCHLWTSAVSATPPPILSHPRRLTSLKATAMSECCPALSCTRSPLTPLSDCQSCIHSAVVTCTSFHCFIVFSMFIHYRFYFVLIYKLILVI